MVISWSFPSLPNDISSSPTDVPRGNPSAPPVAGGYLTCRKKNNQTRISDQYLLESGYMSDCTVICGNSTWNTHKTILCSRNNWFRAALTRGFQEALTGTVTIEDTRPDVVNIVLTTIYNGEIDFLCTTPADVVELWKAGNFFGMQDLRQQAEIVMLKRLKNSAEFLQFSPKHKTSSRADNDCNTITVVHDLCHHFRREARVCPVSNSQGNDVFRVCGPHVLDRRPGACDLCGELCGPCEKLLRNAAVFENVIDVLDVAAEKRSSRYQPCPMPTPPKDKTRESIESEIQDLCEALNIALADTPKESRIHTMLLDHMCKTLVEPWGGVEVCRFLERQDPVA